MANVDRANGFRPVKSLIGAPWTSLVRTYPAASGRTASTVGDIYIGSVVTLSGGNVVPATTSATDKVLGVVVAVGTKNSDTALNTDNNHRYYDPDNLGKRYLAHDEDGYVGVVPAEACLFTVQAEAGVALQDAVQGDGAAYAANAGSRTTGNSTVTIGAGTGVEIVEHVTSPDNDVSEAGGLARFIVRFIVHQNAID